MNLTMLKWAAIGLVVCLSFIFGWNQGSLNVQAQWAKEKAELNAQAAKEIEEANNRVRAVERESYIKVAKTEQLFNKKLREKSNEEASALDRARNGGLFVNAKCTGRSNTVPGTTSSSSSSDGETRVELSKEDGEFLIRIAAEADRVTEQLSACQKLLEDERK
jgi:hypothetical protein